MSRLSHPRAAGAAWFNASPERLRLLAASLRRAQEEEREGLVRDLEDKLGGPLVGLNLALSQLGRTTSRSPHVKAVARQARSFSRTIETCLESIQQISSKLRPSVLDDFGFAAAVEWQAKEFESATGIRYVLETAAYRMQFAREDATALFRIFQELLDNVARHSRASEVRIRLGLEGGCFILEVVDNGQGITLAEMTDSRALGLLNIRERARSLGGIAQVRGNSPRGTAVTLRIPLVPVVHRNGGLRGL